MNEPTAPLARLPRVRRVGQSVEEPFFRMLLAANSLLRNCELAAISPQRPNLQLLPSGDYNGLIGVMSAAF